MELEHQCSNWPEQGREPTFNMWPGGSSHVHLSAMQIEDPFPGLKKTLWIRYVRAGDGERGNSKMLVDADGTVHVQEVPMDQTGIDPFDTGQLVKMSISKEEFVCSILSSPLLAETLRKMSTSH